MVVFYGERKELKAISRAPITDLPDEHNSLDVDGASRKQSTAPRNVEHFGYLPSKVALSR